MRPITVNLLIVFAILLGMTNVSLALPACPSSGYKHNCFGTYTWAPGSKYVGEWRDNKRNGRGSFVWSKGDKYIGEWQNDNRTGQGTYTFADGEKYVGEFKDNNYSGQGTLTQANGNKYVGEHKDDERHGQGTYTWKDGEKWVGEWEDGELSGYAIKYFANGSINQEGIFKNGKFLNAQHRTSRNSTLPDCPSSGDFNSCYGTYVFPKGDKYVGEWKDDKRNGQGTNYYLADNQWKGDKHVGKYKDDKRNGKGTYTYASGDKYVGEYKDNKIHGQGTYTHANGDKYVGEFKSDKKHGQGTFTWASRDNYVGEWKDGKQNGQGAYYYSNGTIKYVGEYKDGKWHGQGTYTWVDGRKDVGTFENNKLNGYAIRYAADSSIDQEGIFKDDKFLYTKKRTSNNSTLPACPSSGYRNNCFGTYIWASGSKYVGEYKDNKRTGQGTYTWASGDKYVGEFKDGKKHGQGAYAYGPNSKWAGDKYVGEYKDNKRTGQGTYTWASGDKYVGEYKDNKRHSWGTYTYGSNSKWAGDKYVGEHSNGQRHGQGTYTHAASGNKYVGEYKNHKMHGEGTFTFADGSKIVGAWENDNLNGYAITYYADGSINQEGIFKDDKFLYAQNSKHPPCPSDQAKRYNNCYGTYVFASGNKYVGEFKDDKRHGQGTFTWVGGDKYIGEYKDGKWHGQGTYIWANGDKYVGEYKDGKWHGQGTYTWIDGRKDIGTFENNKLNGYAIRYAADGSINQEGIFKDDKFLYAQNSPSNNNQNTCNEDPALCTIVQLCSKASHYYGGKKKWKTNYSSKKYIIEADKNGVSCGVNSEIAQSKKDEILPAASGSGFFITKDGHIITNEHVIEGCQTVKVHQQGTSYTSKILSADKFNDLALIKIEYNPKVVFSLTTKPPYLGQDIIAAGYPLVSDLGNSLKVTSGIVSALSAIDDTSKFQMDVPVQPGNSGGPIFDVNGNILGVVVARSTHKETQLVNFGIKAATVRNLLDSNNIKLLPPNIKPINKREFSEAMTKGTVLLSCWMTLTQIEKANAHNTGKVFFKEFQK